MCCLALAIVCRRRGAELYGRCTEGIRAAHKGRKSWNPPEAQKGLRAASLGIPAALTSGSLGRRSLQDIAGVGVSNVLGSFFDKFITKN